MTYEMRMKQAVESHLNSRRSYSDVASQYGVDRNELQRRVMKMALIRSLDNNR